MNTTYFHLFYYHQRSTQYLLTTENEKHENGKASSLLADYRRPCTNTLNTISLCRIVVAASPTCSQVTITVILLRLFTMLLEVTHAFLTYSLQLLNIGAFLINGVCTLSPALHRGGTFFHTRMKNDDRLLSD